MPPPYHEKLQMGLLAGVSSLVGAAAHTAGEKGKLATPGGETMRPAFTARSRHTILPAGAGGTVGPGSASLKRRRPAPSVQQPRGTLRVAARAVVTEHFGQGGLGALLRRSELVDRRVAGVRERRAELDVRECGRVRRVVLALELAEAARAVGEGVRVSP